MAIGIRRRQFISVLGGGVIAWPLAARAQQTEVVRRIGVLVASAEDDPEMQARLAAFRQALEKLGWSEGHNVRIEYRFAGGSGDQIQPLVKELLALQPDVIVAQSPPIASALQRENHAIPIVFLSVGNPIGLGFIASLARPGGNLTGLTTYEASIAGKWLAMLKEIAPDLSRAAIVGNPRAGSESNFDYYLRAAGTSAASLGIELLPSPFETAAEVEHGIDSFADKPNGGLIVLPDPATQLHRNLIIALAAQHRLPAVYNARGFVAAGGLMSYGIDRVDEFRQVAFYVDHILRGDKPADLPVQAPTKYETIVNLKTARAIGLTVPPGLLVAADEVIE
jgi:putative tryptophan/tyrosine transport system substrate-binding protein